MTYKIFILTILIITTATVAEAKEYPSFGPLNCRNQSPLYLQFVNLVPDDTRVLEKNQMEVRIDSAYSNIYERTVSNTHDWIADMELWRIGIDASYGLGKNFEVGIEIPFLHLEGGFLDEFVQDYHNAFGFPNGGRQWVANGDFNYRLSETAGNTIYQINQEDFNLGDITFRFKHHLYDEGKRAPAVAYTFYFKLPTGQDSQGLGSGYPGYGLALALEKSYKRLHGYLNAGPFVTGIHDDLEDYHYTSMLSWMVALEFTLLDNWSLVTQILGSTPLFHKTNTNKLDAIPLDLNIGIRGEQKGLIFENDFIWQFGFQEDINPEGPSIDFTLFASIGMKFKTRK
ncbi:DUF3187 family protein [bacterium]|nr:DUF3187 family protein [bacterium]